MASVEDLQKQNASLKEQLNKIEQTAEHKKVFDGFDTDKNGTIEKNEFQDLCFECGVVVEDMDSAFDEIDTDKSGKIDFFEFNAWLLKHTAEDDEEAKGESNEVYALRTKLLGKYLVRQASTHAAEIYETATTRDLTLAKKEDAGEAGGDGDDNKFLALVEFLVGDQETMKTGIKVKYRNNAEEAAATKQAIGAPDDAEAFAFIELACKDDASEESIGALCELLTTHLDGLPPVAKLKEQQMLKDITAQAVEVDDGKAIRVSAFFAVNPLMMAQMMIGANPVDLLDEAVLELETGLSIDDLSTEGYNIVDNASVRFLLKLAGDRQILELLGKMQKLSKKGLRPDLFRAGELKIKLTSLRELAEGYESPDAMPKFLRKLTTLPSGPEILQGIEMMGPMILGESIPPPFLPLYASVREVVKGFNAVTVQAGDASFGIQLNGLNLMSLLPELIADTAA